MIHGSLINWSCCSSNQLTCQFLLLLIKDLIEVSYHFSAIFISCPCLSGLIMTTKILSQFKTPFKAEPVIWLRNKYITALPFIVYRYEPTVMISSDDYHVCNFVSDTLLPTIHLAPRSLCTRRTVQWQPDSSECGRSLIKWECGGRWKVSLSSMNIGCLMCYFCSWGQLSLTCE